MTEKVPMPGPLVHDEKQLVVQEKKYDFYLDYNDFDEAQRRAISLSKSGLVPDRFRGEANIGSVLQALHMARQLNCDVMAVFQNVYNVKGQIGLTGKFIHALLNNCGYFTPLDFEFIYDDYNKVISCTATAEDLRVNKIRTMTLTWEEVKVAGWDRNRSGMPSPWIIYRKSMFVYRVTSYFVKTFVPEILLGMQSVEELRDIERNKTTTIRRRKPITSNSIREPEVLLDTTPTPTIGPIEDEPALHEYEPPPVGDNIPYPDDENFDPAMVANVDSERASGEDEPQSECWWDDMRHWQYRKPIDFYMLVAIGFGVAFRRHTVKMFDQEGNQINGYELTKEDQDRYFKMTRENPDSICSLPDATPEMYERITRKFVVNCGFDKNVFVDFENS